MEFSCIGSFYKTDIPIQNKGGAYSYSTVLTLDTTGKYRFTQTSVIKIIPQLPPFSDLVIYWTIIKSGEITITDLLQKIQSSNCQLKET